ncbi:MAG: hypothetical protein AAGI88_17490 [Pseudomonadota bacterium]
MAPNNQATSIEQGVQEAGDRLDEWLATVGLCRWADGTCRPAWDTFLGALRNQAQARP